MSNDDEFVIFPPFESFYIVTLLSCTESALISAEWVSRFLQERAKTPDKFSPQAVLNHLQNIALQGAAISRFFWPPDKKYKRRGAFLRERFKLDDSNPLRSRELRNRMEHYDEYLDDYFSKQDLVGHIIPDYVGYEPTKEEVPFHLFRAYFIDTGRVAILGVRFELQPLVDEILRLHYVLQECDKNGSRFPRERA
jgi:hypothetical protein